MISFESLRTPRPMDIVVVWEGQDLHVTYDRAAFTIEMTEGVYRMPIRERMARVLLGWDLLKGGQPWQPLPKDDPSWDAAIQAARPEGADVTPSTTEERERAYQAAWDAILLQLPRPFVRAVDTGVLDDFLGVSWRGAISANGSAPTRASAGSTGGMSS
jgi:transposase